MLTHTIDVSITGVLAKGKSFQLSIIEKLEVVDKSLEAALSHLKEKPSYQRLHFLTPFDVFCLFKKMLDEVHALVDGYKLEACRFFFIKMFASFSFVTMICSFAAGL